MRIFKAVADWLESWLLWSLITGLGWSVGLVITLAIAQVPSLTLPWQASWVVGGVVVGVLIGLAQWQILGPEIKGVGWWALASAAGWTAGLFVTAYGVRLTGWVLAGGIGAISGGFVFGLAQWLALRPDTRGRGRWMLGTIVGWTGALTLGITLAGGRGPDIFTVHVIEVIASGAVGWVVIGLVAILALVWLFPGPQRKYATHVRWWP